LTRRILTIVVAIVLALVGVVAVLAYVKQADQRALEGQQPVTVYVAAQQVPAGTSASTAKADGLLVRQKLPAKSVPADAVRSIGPANGSLVLSASLPSGELLLQPMLVTSVLSSTGLAIPKGMVAVTIPLCVPQAVAGYIYPQSQVAIFDTIFTGKQTGQTSCGSGGTINGDPAQTRTRIVLSRVTVLAIGTASDNSRATATTSVLGSSSNTTSTSSSSSSQGNVLVTLAVDQNDAERVITLAQAGVPWLALLSKSSVVGSDQPTLQLFPPYK
jgi:pilus assembly protein CpaB